MLDDFDNSVYVGRRVDRYCPQCGAQLLGNPLGDTWCSIVACHYIHFGFEAEIPLDLDRETHEHLQNSKKV